MKKIFLIIINRWTSTKNLQIEELKVKIDYEKEISKKKELYDIPNIPYFNLV
jgi:hypothetical protein